MSHDPTVPTARRDPNAGARDAATPSLDLDLFGRRALADPLPHMAAVRAAGPAVWLPRNRLWAIGRYQPVYAALRSPEVFASGRGVAANTPVNALSRSTVLCSDADDHQRRRRVLLGSLAPKSLTTVQATLEQTAEELVTRLVRKGDFDGVRDFASTLPVDVVADLVGLRVPAGRLLAWGGATFDALGPYNRGALGSAARAGQMLLFARRLRARDVTEGGWAASVFRAADEGTLTRHEARTMIIDFVAPSLDTTILASAHMLWLLGVTPGLWQRVRDDPAVIPSVVAESVRLSSPVRAFTRYVTRDTEVGGVPVPAGSRALLLYAAANRDPDRFPDPDRVDLDRRSGDQLGWGTGPHTCVGMHLAKLEMAALLRAMVPRVASIRVGRPTPLRNNVLQGMSALPAAFTPA